MKLNKLSAERSLYLRRHQDDPVSWWPWGAPAFAYAKAHDKPILLSVGFASCHWCHVMARENFRDAETAALMNERFVSVLVDREERPEIDAIYMRALTLMGQRGGWPLTMFLTPDGKPFWGGTYFPSGARDGLPAFRDVIVEIGELFVRHREVVERNTKLAMAALERFSSVAVAKPVEAQAALQSAEALASRIDSVHGGFGAAPKFPHVPALRFLWNCGLRAGRSAFLGAVRLSLEGMCLGGLYDHVGGGFARYASDRAWLVPHFEKMLSDNALLVELLCAVWRQTQSTFIASCLRDTVKWALREMVAPQGGFISGLDAESGGQEGAYYAWSVQELERVLGADARLFGTLYATTLLRDRGISILHRGVSAALEHRQEEFARACLGRLLEARALRAAPARDEKVLADWNGLMIAALADAAATFREPEWLRAAKRAFGFIADDWLRKGQLCHVIHTGGRNDSRGYLDDYACMSRAALALHSVTGSAEYLAIAEQLIKIANEECWDNRHGGYYQAPAGGESLIVRMRSADDSSTPAGNAVMAEVLSRLYFLTASDAYRDRAQALIDAFSGRLGSRSLEHAALFDASELLRSAVQILVIGDPASSETIALRDAAFSAPIADLVFSIVLPDSDLPSRHPACGKRALDGRATAFICVGNSCSMPVTTGEAMVSAIRGAPSGAQV